MSALPPKADMVQRSCDVRFVPKADIARPFEHFVGGEPYALQHRGSFRGLTMNDCSAARSSGRERSFSAPRYR
jgi:hypothetical protein